MIYQIVETVVAVAVAVLSRSFSGFSGFSGSLMLTHHPSLLYRAGKM